MTTRKSLGLHIQLCNPNASIPTYANELDSGADVSLCEPLELKPGQTELVGLGFKVAVPVGYELQVRPRSGLSYKTKLRIPNSPGTIDTNFRDEVKVILHNIGDEKIVFEKGDRIAQLVLCESPKAKYIEVENIDDIEGNRGGGFGSSG